MVQARMREAEEAGENMAALGEALAPQLERERRDQAGREVQAEENIREAPWRVFLREFTETWAGEEGGTSEGRSELEMTLGRVEKRNGSETFVTCHKVKWTPDEAATDGAPDLEGIAMEYARETGVFGPYAWKLRGWSRGELVRQTTLRMHLAPPLGYKPAPPPPMPEEKKDPMGEMMQTLTLFRTIKEAVGGGDGGGNAQAAAANARWEASEAHRKELRDLEDRQRRETRDMEERHARVLKEAEAAAYERGRSEGERTAREAYERKVWELERDLERLEEGAAPVPDLVDKVVSAVGGPDAVKAIIGAVLSAQNRRPAMTRPAAPLRPMPKPIQAAPVPPAPSTVPAAVPESSPMKEPSPEEMAEALEALEAACAAVRHSPEFTAREEFPPLAAAFENLANQVRGAQGAAVASVWEFINRRVIPHDSGVHISYLDLANEIAPIEEEPEDMNIEDMKALLTRRLRDGATPEGIMAELRGLVPESTIAQWRSLLSYIPTNAAMEFLAIPEDLHAQGAELLKEFANA